MMPQSKILEKPTGTLCRVSCDTCHLSPSTVELNILLSVSGRNVKGPLHFVTLAKKGNFTTGSQQSGDINRWIMSTHDYYSRKILNIYPFLF